MTIRVITGNALDVLKTLPERSVHCAVSSPPYWGLRSYLPDGHDDKHLEVGLEDTPDAFVARLVGIFAEVRRVLRDDGTCWLNLGDSYAGGGNYRGINSENTLTTKQASNRGARGLSQQLGALGKDTGLEPKNLVGIPWRVAFALQADGWYLRSEIIWHKPNPMPESVTDRPTKAHEYIFLLSKSPTYYYDADAIREDNVDAEWTDKALNDPRWTRKTDSKADDSRCDSERMATGQRHTFATKSGRNKRSVWTVTTKPFSGAHFATFPPDLIEPCILAGCPAQCCSVCVAPWERVIERTAMVIDRSERTHDLGRTRSSGTMLEPPTSTTLGFSPSCSCNAPAIPGTVLDCFGGAGTTGLVADRLQRNAILIELNPAYADMARNRITNDAPLFVEVVREVTA